jgi:hypothetical protein
MRTPPVQALAKGYRDGPRGTDILDQWADPCGLEPHLLEQRSLEYDLSAFPFVEAARSVLRADTANLGQLHREVVSSPDRTAPMLRRAQIQAQHGQPVSKAEAKNARNHAWNFDRSPEWRAFMELYKSFVEDWVMPQVGNVPILYQRKPILRVVLPGSVRPTAMHCDADYYHSANELNFWVPLSAVSGSNSLWSESAPGRGDFAPFLGGPGQAIRFYGNRCRHYTTSNAAEEDGGTTRVSFDFRVIPLHLFRPPNELASRLSKHALDPGASKRGYYGVLFPEGYSEGDDAKAAQAAGSGRVAELALSNHRRAWRAERAVDSQLSHRPVTMGPDNE